MPAQPLARHPIPNADPGLLHQGHGLDLGMDLLTGGQGQAVAGLAGDAGEDDGSGIGLRCGPQAQLDQESGALTGAHFQDVGGKDVKDTGGGGRAKGDADIAGLNAHPGAGAGGSGGVKGL